jgi:hypothetical protein
MDRERRETDAEQAFLPGLPLGFEERENHRSTSAEP